MLGAISVSWNSVDEHGDAQVRQGRGLRGWLCWDGLGWEEAQLSDAGVGD